MHDALRILQLTPAVDLRRTGRLELVRGDVSEFRVAKLRDHWIRLLVAYVPTGADVVILSVVVKKTNRLDPDDIDQAMKNLKLYKVQIRRR